MSADGKVRAHGEVDDLIGDVFGADGMLAQQFEGYAPRTGQIELSTAVLEAIEAKDHLIAEGPTGTGKSFAYLVPAIYHAVTKGKRIVVATANIALQEQLVQKDLPLLQKILPWEFKFMIFKGKGNYLCQDSLSKIHGEGALTEGGQAKLFGDDSNVMLPPWATYGEAKDILDWSGKTEHGDKSELPFVPDGQTWSRFSVGADDCKGKRCRHASSCYSLAARKGAEQCHVVVVNFHVLFANLKYGGAVLPPFDVAILDEAHEAADVARDFLGYKIGPGTFTRLSKKLKGYREPKLADRIKSVSAAYFDRLKLYAKTKAYDVRLRKTEVVKWNDIDDVLDDALEVFGQQHASASAAENKDAMAEAEISVKRAKGARAAIRDAMTFEDDNYVRFISVDKADRIYLEGKPINVSGLLREGFFNPTPSVIVTSATLTVNDSFDHCCFEIGLREPRELVAESPFSPEQSLFIVPRDGPLPNKREEFIAYVAERTIEVIRMARGRTLCLFTSWGTLNAVHRIVEKKISDVWVFKQGDKPRTQLVEEFKSDTDSVLMGTRSFWAGVDVPGESLSCLIIDKIPFPTPNDPILDALQERAGRSSFGEHSVPRAIIAFKQGVGRLIRSVTDKGVIVCFDRRLFEKGYGRQFLRSLPEMATSSDLDDVWQFLGTTPLGSPDRLSGDDTEIDVPS